MTDRDSAQPKRRFLDLTSGPPSLIGRGARFEGRLDVPGPLTLGGTVQGDGSVAGLLSVARDAHWEGNVHAESAVIAGRVTGNLTVEKKLEIGPGAVILGAVSAHVVAIADGAVVDGPIRVTGSEPVVHFEEKRATSA